MRTLVIALSFLAVAAAFFAIAGSAEATNTGTVTYTTDTTWTAANSPYNVTGTVRVRNDATLTVEAGVTINFVGGNRIYIGDPNAAAGTRVGKLILDGTASSPVVVSPGTIEFDGWNGAAGASIIRNATFTTSGVGLALELNTFSPLTILDSTFFNATSYSVYLSASSPTIADTTFTGSPYGIYATNWDSTPTLVGNTFADQTVRYARVGAASFLDGNTFTGTGTGMMLLAGNRWYDSDLTLRAEPVTYYLHNWLGVRNGATLTIEPGFNALGADDFYFYVGDPWSGTPSVRPAKILALGTEAEPIVIGSQSGSPTNGWDGFQFNGWNGNALASEIRNATLRHATTHDIYSNQWSALTIDNSTLENSSTAGLYLDSASPTVRNTRFYGSPYGIYGGNWAARPTVLTSTFWNQTTRHARIGVESYLDGNTFSGTGTAVELHAGNRWHDSNVTLRTEPVLFHLYNWLGVRNGATLTIEPGFNALGADDFYFYIGDPWSGTPSVRPAKVIAAGTETDRITIGSISGSPTNGWDGFQFNGWNGNGLASELRNITLRHAQYQDVYSNGWSALTIDNSTLENSSTAGLYLDSASPLVQFSTFRGSANGIYSGNWVSRPTVVGNTFVDQTNRHARLGLTSFFDENQVEGTGTAVELLAGNRWIDETDVTIRNNDNVPYDLYNWFGQRYDHTFTIEPGVVVRSASDVTINLGEPGSQATTGLRALWGVYSANSTAFAFHEGTAGSGCSTNGPDLRGYVCESIPYAFTNISTTGTTLPICDNCVSGAIPIGFNFSFYDGTFSNAYVAENGFLTFSPGQSGHCCSAQFIPAYGSPDNLVAGFFDDLRLIQGGNVKYQTIGVEPARSFIVQWTAIPHCCDQEEIVTFQIVLREGSNVAEVHLERAIQDGSNHVTGVESAPLPEYPRGRIVAEGTEAEPIVLQSLSGTSSGWWQGLRFQGSSGAATSDSVMRNVTVRQSRDQNARFDTWSVGTFDNVTFRESLSYSLYLESGSSPTFRNFVANGTSSHNVFVSGGSWPTFYGGELASAAGYGMYVNDVWSVPRLVEVDIHHNAQRPLRIPLHADYRTSTFTGNAIQEIEYLARDYTSDLDIVPHYDAGSGARLTSVLLQSFTMSNQGTLTLAPDLRLLVAENIQIAIGSCCGNPTSRGNLTAEGTEAQPIYVGSRSGSNATGWYGFYFRGDYAPGHAVIRNTTIALSKDSNVETYGYSDLLLDNVTVERSREQAMIFYYSNPTLKNVDAIRPGWEAFFMYYSNPTWRGGTVEFPGRSGFYASGCGHANLYDIVVEKPGSYGFYADGSCNGANLYNVQIRNATNRAWRIRTDNVVVDSVPQNAAVRELEYWGGDITTDKTLTLHYDPVDSGKYTNVLLSSFTVYNQATYTIPANSTILVENAVQLAVGSCCSNPTSRGNLTAEGTEAEPIVFTSRSGNNVTGWYGLYFRGDYAPGHSVLRNVTLALSRDANLETYGYSDLLLDNVTLDRSQQQAMIFYYSNPTLRNVDAIRPGWEAFYMYYSNPVWRDGFVDHPGRSGFYGSGCGIATLENIVVESATGYGWYSDGSCNGAHLDNVQFLNASGRAWRNRLDTRHDSTIVNAGIDELEFWGSDLTSDRTLLTRHDELDGARLTSIILSGFTVYNQATWTIEPGGRVLVENGHAINIGSCCSNPTSRGNLSAIGTAEEPIVITSKTGSSATGWYGLYFRGDYAPGTSVLRNVTIGLSRDEGIETYYYSALTLDNVTLDRNARWGAQFYCSSPTLIEPHIVRSGSHGIYHNACGTTTIRGGLFENNNGNGYFSADSSSGATILGTAFQNNTVRPFKVRITDTVVDPIFRNNTIQQADYHGVDITSDRTLQPFYDADTGARYTSVISSGFTVYNQATWTIAPDTRVLVENGHAINIGSCCSNPSSRGNLSALGTAAQPITFSAYTGSSSTGWYGLYFRGDYAPGTSTIRNATIALSRDEGVETYYYGSLTLDNVTLDRNARYGMQINGASATLRNVVSNGSGSYGAYFTTATPTWAGGGVTTSGSHGIYWGGCGVGTLQDLVIDRANGYGMYADSTCNGAHMNNVLFSNTTGRPFRNRMDASMTNLTTLNPGIAEVELWAMTISGARTLTLEPVRYADTGLSIPTVLTGTPTINGGAELELAPDLVLRMPSGGRIDVGSSSTSRGRLVSPRATKEHPVNISGVNLAPGGWGHNSPGGQGSINLEWVTGVNTLTNVTIDGGSDNIRVVNGNAVAFDNVTSKRGSLSGLASFSSGNRIWVNQSNFTGNVRDGLYLENGGILEMNGANFSRNGFNGLEVRAATATVRGSMFFENGLSGINATGGNPAMTVTQSYLWRNGDRGVELGGTTGSTVYDNAFIENVKGQAHATAWNRWNVTPTAGRNIAYGPFLGGNSWSDYPGEDTDADGLGDTLVPYTTGIAPGGDSHPVMGNLYADFVVEILDIVNFPHDLIFRDASRGGFSPADQWVWDLGDGSQFVTQNVTYTFAADGSYPVQLVVANPHGQLSSITRTVHVDSVAPLTNHTFQGTESLTGWFTTQVNVTLNGTDDRSGVNKTFYRLDGGALTQYSAKFPVTSNGLHNVSYYSVDKNGNVEATRFATFQVDRTIPVALNATLNGTLGNAGWWTSTVNATLNATDNVSGVNRMEYAFNATPSILYEGPVPIATDGVHLLRYKAVDNALLSSTEKNVTIRRDATPPEIEVASDGLLGGGGFWLGPVTLNASALDLTSGLASFTYRLDGGNATPVSGSILVSGHGVHYVNFTATDVAGNVNDTRRVVLQIDLSAPLSEHHFDGTLGANGVYVSNVTVTFSGNDTLSGIDHYLYAFDDGPEATFTAPVVLNVAGQHRLVYRAVDVAGNVETIHEVIVTLDLEAPTTSLNLTGLPGQNGWFLSNVTANLTVDDYSTLDHIVFGLVVGNTTNQSTYTTEFPVEGDGIHNVTFHSVSIGGLQEEPQFRLVKIDLYAPTLGVALNGTLGTNGWYISPVSAALLPSDSASGIATSLVSADGAPPSTYTGPVSFTTTGPHTIAGRTTDVAGRSTDLANVSFQVDVSDPVTTLALSPAAPNGANGWYVTSPSLTLSATDVGAGVDAILVSIDGAPETPFTGAIALGEGVHNVTFRALDLAGRSETLRNATIKVDLTVPTLDETLAGTPGLAGWYTSAVNATLAPTDATSGVASIFASVNGGPESAVTGAIALTTTRTHTIAWRAVDAAGLVANETLTVKVDRSAPTTTPTITPPPANGWRNQVATVTLAATDQPGFGSGVASIESGLDGGALATYTGPFQVGEGFHNLSFRGIDVAGLVNSTVTQALNVDLTPPTLTYGMRPADQNGWYLANVPVNFTATDALSGFATIEWWIDNGAHTNTSSLVVTLTQQGSHVLHVRARDVAQLASATIDIPFSLDTSVPTLSHTLTGGTFGGNNRTVAWYRTPVNVTLVPADLGSGIAQTTYRLDGGDNTTYVGPIAFATEGSRNVSAWATDNVARVSAQLNVPAFGVDLTPPATIATFSIDPDPADDVYKSPVTISLAASDALSGVAPGLLRVNNGTGWVAYTGARLYDASGTYSLDYYATDVAGNVETIHHLVFTVFVDTTPPVTTLTPPPTGWYATPINVTLRATDSESSILSVLYELNEGGVETVLGNVTTIPLSAEGIHTLKHAAIDVANNGGAFNTSTYRLDLTPPTLSLAESFTQGENGWIVSPVDLTPTAVDALSGISTVKARVNGVEQTVNGTLRLAQSGWYNVTFWATDLGGLPSNLVNWSGHLDLDAPRPTVTVVGPQGLGGWLRGNASVLLTATDGLSGAGLRVIEYSWDNESFAPYPGSAFQFTTEGLHWLQVRAIDLAGNVGLANGTQVGIDATKPFIGTVLDGTEGNDGWWISPVTATTTVTDLPGIAGAATSGVHNFTQSIDGGANESATLPSVVTFATSSLEHTISMFALDRALNLNTSLVEIPVDVDDPALLYDLTGPEGLAGWYVGPVTLNASSTDVTSGPLAPLLNGEAMADPVEFSEDGMHAVVLNARDVAGRLAPATSFTIPVDSTPPEPVAAVTGDAPGDDGWFHGNATVGLSMVDALSGPGLIQFRVDGGALHTYAGPFNLTTDGIHVIDWVALDIAGNLAERNFTVKLDNEVPTAVADITGVVGNRSWFKSGVNITLNATDLTSGVASIEYRLDGGAWLPYFGEPIAITTEGRHTLEYRAIDGSGLPSITYYHEILIDATTPIVDIHLENTLFVEFDGKLYIKGTLCVEISGLDLLSGLDLNSLFLRVTGAVTKLVKIDLDVSLACIDFEAEGGGGGGGGGGCGVCAIGADMAGNEVEECFDAIFDGSAPYLDIVRPFPGALNLQNTTIPLFKTAFQQGATVSTPGIFLDQETPDGRIHLGNDTTVRADNQTLAQTTLVAGTRVPVWVAAGDAWSPMKDVELRVDDVLVGKTNKTENVTFQYILTHPSNEGWMFEEEPTLQVPPRPVSNETPDEQEHDVRVINVTMPVYVFHIDTLALPSGDHNLTARASDILGHVAKLTKLVGYVSPAIGNATVDLLEEAARDRSTVKGETPNEVKNAFPLDTWDENVPDEDIPDMPDPIRERAEMFLAAARIAGGLYDFLATDNYAFVDRTVIEFFDVYETADEAMAGLPAPLPNTHLVGLAPWVRAVDSEQIERLVPEELPFEVPDVPELPDPFEEDEE